MNAEALLEHRDFLRSLAQRLVFAGEDADDVVQETYARAVAHPPKPGPGIRGWLATVARNVVWESRRCRLRRLAREAAVAGGETTPSAEDIREREAARSRVVTAVLELDEPYRAAILLRFYENMPPRTIARRTGIPVETVRTRQKRAMAMLRARLDGEYGGDRKAWTAALLPLAAAKASARVGASLFIGAATSLIVAMVFTFGGVGDDPLPPTLPVADGGGEPVAGGGETADASGERPAGAVESARPGEHPAPPPGGILVVDSAGRPADARVSTTPERVADMNRALSLGRTEADGEIRSAEFSRLPRKYVWARGERGVAGPVAWSAAGALLVLGEGRMIAGTVRDGEGRPVAGAIVGSWAITDVNGRYRLPRRFPGTPYSMQARLVGAPGNGGEPVEVVLREDEEVRNLDLVVERPKAPELLVVLRGGERGVGAGELKLRFEDRNAEARFIPGKVVRILVSARAWAGKRVLIRATLPGAGIVETHVEVPQTPRTVEVPLSFGSGRAMGRGLVLDAAGRPAVGAEIYASDDPAKPHRSDLEVETDADGVFPLTPRLTGRHLLARGPDGTSAWALLDDRREDVVLRLGPGGIVEGRVKDAGSGEPVPFAPVHLVLGEETLGPLTWVTGADAAGRYRFAGVPLGMLVLPFVPDCPRATPIFNRDGVIRDSSRAEIIEAGYAAVLVKEGDVFPRDLPVRRNPGGEVTFRLGFPEGRQRPEGVRVRHRLETPFAWGSGEEVLPLDPGTGSVTLYLNEGTHSLAFRSAELFAVSGRIVVEGDRDPEERALAMAPLPPVEVRLVGGDGRDLARANVMVWVEVEGEFAFGGGKAPTDARGRARLDDVFPPPIAVKAGRILLWIEAKGLYSGSEESPDQVLTAGEYLDLRRAAGTELLTIHLPVRSGRRIEVPVLDAADRPVAGVRVTLHPKGAFSTVKAVSDGAGILHLDLLDGRRAEVRADAPFAGTLEIDEFLDEEDRHREREERALCVSKLRTVRVLCVDGSGQPLPGLTVDLFAWGRALVRDMIRQRLTTDAEGRLSIELPDLDLTVQMSVSGRTGVGIELEPGRTEVRVVFESVRKLFVEVVAPPDYKEDRVYVALRESDRERGKGKLVERKRNRFFEEFEVPARPYRVVARDWVGYWRGEARASAGDRIVRVEISRAPTFVIEARVKDPDGRPVAGKAVEVSLRNHSGDTYEHTARADARGIVRLEVPEGATGDLRVRVDGCIRTRPNPVKLEAPPEEPVEFTAVPGFVLTVQFIMPKGSDSKDWPKIGIRKFGPDGTEQYSRSRRGGYTGNRRSLTFSLTTEPCRFEFEVDGRVFRVEVPGHPIDPPIFDLR